MHCIVVASTIKPKSICSRIWNLTYFFDFKISFLAVQFLTNWKMHLDNFKKLEYFHCKFHRNIFAPLYQCTLHRGQMFSHLGILRMLELLKKCVAWALLSCLVIIIRKHAFRSNPMLLHVCFPLFSSYSSPCMLYVYAIYVHVCILTTTYNVIRVSKTYLAVTNNARWSIRSSNWWENAQVRLAYALNYVL
jgi:hypothetical protein